LWPTLKKWRPLALAPIQTDRHGENVQPPTRPNPEELKARCLHLGKEVEVFDNSRRGMPGNATKDDVRRRDEETIRLYRDRLKPKIMRLYDELAQDWFDEGDRELFENVSEWHQLEDVAERLKTVGKRLPGG